MEMEIEPPPKSGDSNESSPLSPDSNMPLRDLIEIISEINDRMRKKLVEKIRASSDIPSNNLPPKDNSSANNLDVKPPDNGLPRPISCYYIGTIIKRRYTGFNC